MGPYGGDDRKAQQSDGNGQNHSNMIKEVPAIHTTAGTHQMFRGTYRRRFS